VTLRGLARIINRVLRAIALLVVALVLTVVVGYAVGLRVVMSGDAMPGLAFTTSEAQRAAEIAQHRAAQRAASPPAAPPAPLPPADVPAATTPATTARGERASRDPLPAPYWTDFRGPARDGHYRQRPILTEWPAGGLRPLWKQPVGSGYASFVAARGRAFTIEQRGAQEVVAAYDVSTGRELWTHTWDGIFRQGMSGAGPRATPTWHDGVVYALGAMGELRALADSDGRQIWRTGILEDAGAANTEFGMSASPLVVDDNVVVLPGGRDGTSIAAYDRRTGRRVWSALPDAAAYSSPMLATIAEVRQIVVLTDSRVVGLTPDRGDLLWEFPWPYANNASQPLILGDRVFVSTSSGGGAVMLQLTREGGRFSVRALWQTNRMKNKFTSSVHHDGFIYGLDEAILACLDAATGELKWKGGRYGHGQVILASRHLIVLTEDGDLALVRATPEAHQEVARFAAIDGKTWNHPAIADGILLVRNINEMAAFDLTEGR
jgi:outer membrane protein assembly factor BamB